MHSPPSTLHLKLVTDRKNWQLPSYDIGTGAPTLPTTMRSNLRRFGQRINYMGICMGTDARDLRRK